MKVLTILEIEQNEVKNFVYENLPSDPSIPIKGRVYYNSSLNKLKIFNGITWDIIENNNSPTNIYGSEFDYVYDENGTLTNSITYITKLTLTTSSLPNGLYQIETNYGIVAERKDLFYVRATLNNVLMGSEHHAKVSDVNNIEYTSRKHIKTLSGINTIKLEFRSSTTATDITISNAALTLFRVR